MDSSEGKKKKLTSRAAGQAGVSELNKRENSMGETHLGAPDTQDPGGWDNNSSMSPQ